MKEVEERYQQALAAIDARHWAAARKLLLAVQAQDADYRDSGHLLALVERLIHTEQEVVERRQMTVLDEVPEEEGRGLGRLGLVLFMAGLGLAATLINFLLQAGN